MKTIRCSSPAEKQVCTHPEMVWAILVCEGGAEQIRWTCADCGYRTLSAAPKADHPNHANYPLIVPHAEDEPAVSLRQVRAGSYGDYLASEAWKTKALYYKARALYRCQLCNKKGGPKGKGLDAHHRTYVRVGAELDIDVIVLCRDCHARHHGHIGEHRGAA